MVGYLRNEFPDTDDETFSEALQQVKIEIFPETKNEPLTTPLEKKEKISKEMKDSLVTFKSKVWRSLQLNTTWQVLKSYLTMCKK